MSAKPRPTQSEFLEETLHPKPAVEAPAIRLAHLTNDEFQSRPSSFANLDPLGRLGRPDPLVFASYLITFCVGAAVALAWSYGGVGKEPIAPSTPSPDQKQFNAMSVNLDAVLQSVDRITNNMATNQEQMTRSVSQLAASQEWMTREIADLQTVEQYVLDKISPPPQRPTAPRNHVPRPSQTPMPFIPAARNP
jgi:hypothetical protein